jgi:cation:H+ antiporter
MSLALDTLIALIGLLLLLGGGEFLVRGASSLAARFGVSPLLVGLTVVAFGTSSPELAVNLVAALQQKSELSFGNIFGSNMANIGLIIAAAALLRPVEIKSLVISREVPMMLLATLVAAVLALDGPLSGGTSQVDRGDGLVLMLLFSVFAFYTLSDVLAHRAAEGASSEPAEIPGLSLKASILLTGGGMLALAAGGALTVEGATGIARTIGISEAVIGLTLVAIGTSLPELTASLVATFRGHTDLAVGNVVGSNIFNLLVVLGATSVVRAVPVPEGGLQDIAVVLSLSALLWLTSVSFGRKIVRLEAVLLFSVYIFHLISRAS